MSKSEQRRLAVQRGDCVTEHDGGWFGASGSKDPKDPPKRMFRTKEEAEALDSLLQVTGKPVPPKG